jgi:CIC family chloride channel protein
MDASVRRGASGSAAPSRWFSHQPNVPGRGIVASYSARFWALVVVLGLAAGAAGSLLMALLHAVEHASWAYHSGTFLGAAKAAPAWRHLVILIGAAIIVGVGTLLLQRLPASGGGEITEAIWLRGARLPFLPSVGRGVLSIIAVGMGVSLGREGAPQLAGAATASRLADWASLPAWQRRLLVASGAGAGMAAVYNVPLGGALFALEVLLGTLALPLVLPAVTTSVIATAVAWITLGTKPTYHVPGYGVAGSHIVWALLIGPVAGFAAVAWVRTIARVNALRPRGPAGRLAAPLVIFAALGAISIPYPHLLGNGLDIVQLAAVGGLSLGLLAGVTGTVWTHIWPGAPSGSYALIGGGAFLAAAMQGPLSGVVLVLELTRSTDALMVPTLLAIAEATVIARRLGAPSIYSARLRPTADEGDDRTTPRRSR